jgi:FAD/FMN-containing dehydrogenase
VRCRVATDVIGAVRLARDHGLLAAVRGGGHNIAGNAVCDGGLLIDLSPMRSVRIDSKERIARVEPGVTWPDRSWIWRGAPSALRCLVCA